MHELQNVTLSGRGLFPRPFLLYFISNVSSSITPSNPRSLSNHSGADGEIATSINVSEYKH